MTIGEMLLPEFDQEMAVTRKLLERVPLEKTDWKPHQKSMALGRLAGHVAELPTWAGRIVTTEMIDIGLMMAGQHQPYIPASHQELLQKFDQSVLETRQSIAGASDAHLGKTWSLQFNGQTVASGTRLHMIRSMSMNHMVHHRAQLSVYLRLNDIPLPAMYGPTADEQVMG
jgi:uncharacterized damage-inducible protein DinB